MKHTITTLPAKSSFAAALLITIVMTGQAVAQSDLTLHDGTGQINVVDPQETPQDPSDAPDDQDESQEIAEAESDPEHGATDAAVESEPDHNTTETAERRNSGGKQLKKSIADLLLASAVQRIRAAIGIDNSDSDSDSESRPEPDHEPEYEPTPESQP